MVMQISDKQINISINKTKKPNKYGEPIFTIHAINSQLVMFGTEMKLTKAEQTKIKPKLTNIYWTSLTSIKSV